MSRSTTINRKLKIRAADALQRSAVPALRFLTVEEAPGELILQGRLPSDYYCKLAQETVQPYLNGRVLVNRVEIAAE